MTEATNDSEEYDETNIDHMTSSQKMCPSARAQVCSVLFGVLNAEGVVDFLLDPLEVTEEFLVKAAAGRELEQRFRFAAPCAEGKCAHWKEGHCRVPDITRFQPGPDERPHRCPIRPSCRWFDQEGISACHRCPLIAMKGPHGNVNLSKLKGSRNERENEIEGH